MYVERAFRKFWLLTPATSQLKNWASMKKQGCWRWIERPGCLWTKTTMCFTYGTNIGSPPSDEVFLPEAPLSPLLLPLCSFFLAFSFCYKHFKTFLSHISLQSFGRKDVSLNYFLFLVDVEREGGGMDYHIRAYLSHPSDIKTNLTPYPTGLSSIRLQWPHVD